MHAIFSRKVAALSLLISLASTQVILSATISISDDNALSALRPCASTCIAYLHYGLDCPNNSCFCRTDLRTRASSYISSCIWNRYRGCSASLDYVDAVSVFNRYCQVDMPPAVTAVTTAQNAIDTSNLVLATTTSPTPLSRPTLTPTTPPSATRTLADTAPSSSPSEPSGLSQSDIVGIVVGTVGTVVASLFVAAVIWLFRRRTAKAHESALELASAASSQSATNSAAASDPLPSPSGPVSFTHHYHIR